MNRHFSVVTISLFLFLSVFLVRPGSAQEKLPILVSRLQHSVVTIIVRNEDKQIIGQGTGFFINNGGHVITNRHVLAGAIEGEIRTATGEIYPILRVVGEDKEGDLVRITTNLGLKVVQPVKVNSSLPEVGSHVVVIGSPLGLEQTVTEGIVSSLRESGKLIQITAPISPGSSGSPVINDQGDVIGVATLQAAKGQNLNFAVSARRLLDMKPGAGKALRVWTAGLYGDALEFVEQKNYTTALDTFRKFVLQNPNSEFAADAHYWIAECYYDLGKYDDAFKAFAAYGNKYANGQKVPRSYRMLALSMAKSSNILLDPIGVLHFLIQRYPQSDEAIKARYQLKEWALPASYIFPSHGIYLGGFREANLVVKVNTPAVNTDVSENRLKVLVLDALKNSVPSMTFNDSALGTIGVSLQLAQSISDTGKNEFFGTLTVYVLKWGTNGWGMSHYISGPPETAYSVIHDSLFGVLTKFAADWRRDNP